MKKYFYAYSFLICFVCVFSCKGQEKPEPLKKRQNQTEQLSQYVIKAPEIDPYFIESTGISSSYGPTSITRNIIQDRNGDFWFATWEGIFHYDGKSFINITNKEGLRRFRAFSLLEDKTGNIWFGTIGAGVYLYDGKSFTNFTTEDGLVNNDVGCIYQDSKGAIWFGTRVGLSQYDGKNFSNFTTKNGLIDNDINAIVEDNSGKLWFGTRGEACFYDGQKFTKVTNNEGKSFMNARSVIKDANGNIWLGGRDGLWSYNDTSFTNFATNFIGNIFQDTKGNIWICKSEPYDIYRMSLCQYDPKSLFSKEANFTEIVNGEGQVFGIVEDTDGNIWFGHERGVGRYDGKKVNYFKAN